MYRKRVRRARGKPPGGWAVVWAPALCATAVLFVLLHGLARPARPAGAARCGAAGAGEPPTRVFVHLHKTGGNNLKAALAGFARRNGLRLFHTCHPAEPDGALARLWFGRARKPANATDCNLDALARLPAPARRALDFVSGHQGVGAHALTAPRPAAYFTFLRAPLPRKVSHYAHFEASARLRAAFARAGAGSGRARADDAAALRIALAEERPRAARYLLHANRNYMVKRLAGSERVSEVAADARGRLVDLSVFVGRAALRAARRNLRERFFFVGVTERYAEGLCVLGRLLNDACYAGRAARPLPRPFRFRKAAARRANARALSRAIATSLPPALRSAARASEELDARLHQFAAALFEEQIAQFPECRGVK